MYPGLKSFFSLSLSLSVKRPFVSALKVESLVRNLYTYKQKTLWLPGLKALNGILNIVNRTCDVQNSSGKAPGYQGVYLVLGTRLERRQSVLLT